MGTEGSTAVRWTITRFNIVGDTASVTAEVSYAGSGPNQDLDAAFISAFLDHLEQQRHNGARTRNARLAAVRSLFRFATLRHPEHAALIQRVLAIPPSGLTERWPS